MTQPVTIVGGGWAGLAAAVTLSHHHIPVQVYESAQQLGGRARSVHSNAMDVDNGQHLMIGAYREMLALLKHMDANETELFLRMPQHLYMLDLPSGDVAFDMKLPRLPAPLHLLVGMLRTPSLNWKQKFGTLLRFNKLLNTPLDQDMPVSDWLASANLPEAYVENVLLPLCLAALTTHPQQASARVFQRVLTETFNGPRASTDLLIARKNLGEVFPELARRFIEARGGRVFTGHKLQQITVENQRVSELLINDIPTPVDRLILATPASISAKLLAPIAECQAVSQQLQQLEFEPVTTVYLRYAEQLSLPVPMTGLLRGTAEWLFDRRICGQPGLIAAVISAGGRHDAMSNDQLSEQVAAELSQLFHWPKAEQAFVIREKRATIRCLPDIDKIRPGPQTGIDNLLVCGDYVYLEQNNQPGLPSTLEGALRCGVKCAAELVEEIN